MPQPDTPWNAFEVTKLLISFLTPLSVAGFGWFINRRLKRLDLAQWSNQKLIEKRLVVYDQVAPLLNSLLCFYTWVGHWKDISPDDVIKTKRELDKVFNIYRHIFDEAVFDAYRNLVGILFESYVGAGKDALIRSGITSVNGDRRIHCSYKWDESWNSRFAAKDNESPLVVRENYYQLMLALRMSLGVRHDG